MQANITAIRRVKKMDNFRIGRATGATIVNRPEELKEEDVGTECGLFEVRKIGDEYFSYLVECKNPKACTILLRGPSKDILQEIDRNLQDAMAVARNVMFEPKLCPGGGATEMALSVRLNERAKSIKGVEQYPYKAVAEALLVIPRTLIQNCGSNAIKVLTELRAKQANKENFTWGVNGTNGHVVDMKEYGIWEPFVVKSQTIKTAIESACLLLRVDDIVSGVGRGQGGASAQQAIEQNEAQME
jgi:T-complex protein 1 subunit gamma